MSGRNWSGWLIQYSIIFRDEAGGSRKPIRRAPTSNRQINGPSTGQPGTSRAGLLELESDSGSSLLKLAGTPASKLHCELVYPPSSGPPPKATRFTKKGQLAAEQARREQYAEGLFTELNQVVFKEGLPKETKLVWNKRLLTTAGRAKWHRLVGWTCTFQSFLTRWQIQGRCSNNWNWIGDENSG